MYGEVLSRYSRIRIIVDSRAAGKAAAVEISENVKRCFSSMNGFFEVKTSGSPVEAGNLASEATRDEYSAVIVCGGDESVRRAAEKLINTGTVLGIVPMGEENLLAASFGIPKLVSRAFDLIVGGKGFVEIDVGLIAGKYFFLSAGMGFDTYLCKDFDKETESNREQKVLPYVSKVSRAFKKYTAVPTVIRKDGETSHILPFFIRFANFSRYGAGKPMAAGALPGDGLLDICMAPLFDVRDAAKELVKAVNGEEDTLPGFRCFKSAGPLIIERRETTLLHADGEVFDGPPNFEVKLLPSALKVWLGS